MERGEKMKQPKKPTLKQKKMISREGLDWRDWNVESENEIQFVIIHKRRNERKVIIKW